jgi:alkyl hydroperoxide reductase subunit AhpF
MGFLGDEDVEQLKEIFGRLEREVKISLVTEEKELGELLGEMAATSEGKLVVSVVGAEEGKEKYGIDKVPGMALQGEGVKGRLYFYGHPVGYEMATLIAAILDLGGATQDVALAEATQKRLAAVGTDVHIQVFSTPG